jgi:hypothetical protein
MATQSTPGSAKRATRVVCRRRRFEGQRRRRGPSGLEWSGFGWPGRGCSHLATHIDANCEHPPSEARVPEEPSSSPPFTPLRRIPRSSRAPAARDPSSSPPFTRVPPQPIENSGGWLAPAAEPSRLGPSPPEPPRPEPPRLDGPRPDPPPPDPPPPDPPPLEPPPLDAPPLDPPPCETPPLDPPALDTPRREPPPLTPPPLADTPTRDPAVRGLRRAAAVAGLPDRLCFARAAAWSRW